MVPIGSLVEKTSKNNKVRITIEKPKHDKAKFKLRIYLQSQNSSVVVPLFYNSSALASAVVSGT